MAALEYKPAHLPISATFLEAWTRPRDAAAKTRGKLLNRSQDIEFDDSAKFNPGKCGADWPLSFSVALWLP
jgi:hypothetical protein